MEDPTIKPDSDLEDGPDPKITLSRKDGVGVLPYENDFMVIKVQLSNWEIKRVLIDVGYLVDVLYWDAFERLKLDRDILQSFMGSLVDF